MYQVIDNIKVNLKNQFYSSLMICAFPVLILGLMGPLEIYSANINQLYFGVSDFLYAFLLIDLFFILTSSLFLSLLPAKVYKSIVIIGFIISMLAYIQNLFMNKELMRLDGGNLDWNNASIKKYTIINSVIWVIVLLFGVIVLFKIKRGLEISIKIATFLNIVQILSAVVIIISNPINKDLNDQYALTGTNQYKLAHENNIIVLVLDRYGNRHFDEFLEKNPEYYSALTDFTYYNNANVTYPYTYPSMINTLTHEEFSNKYDEANNTLDYIRSAWTNDYTSSYVSLIHNSGYEYYFYTSDRVEIWGDTEANSLNGVFDNVEKVSTSIDRPLIIRLLAKMSIYKYTPYVLKPTFEVISTSFKDTIYYNSTIPVHEHNYDFCQEVQDKLEINTEVANAITITQIDGMHTPYEIDEYANKNSNSDCETVQKGLSYLLDVYMTKLKELDIYDNATIIIMADHGFFINDKDPQPILFVKRAGETHTQMEINSAPVDLHDIVPTIIDLTGEDYSDYGVSIFDINEDEQRERSFCCPENDRKVISYIGNRNDLLEKLEIEYFNIID